MLDPCIRLGGIIPALVFSAIQWIVSLASAGACAGIRSRKDRRAGNRCQTPTQFCCITRRKDSEASWTLIGEMHYETRFRLRLMNTNRCPFVGSSCNACFTHDDKPSYDFLISAGRVYSHTRGLRGKTPAYLSQHTLLEIPSGTSIP